MSAASLLAEIRTAGIELWAESGRFRYRSPGPLPPSLRERLLAERDALLSYMEHLQAGIEPDAFSATEAKIARARRLGEACAARERRHLGVFQPDPEPLLDQPALRAQAERIRLQAQRLRESCLSQPRVPDMRIVP